MQRHFGRSRFTGAYPLRFRPGRWGYGFGRRPFYGGPFVGGVLGGLLGSALITRPYYYPPYYGYPPYYAPYYPYYPYY